MLASIGATQIKEREKEKETTPAKLSPPLISLLMMGISTLALAES